MTSSGPDLVIAGAARCGTSTLAAAVREHPAIDPGATKEPNYFSRHFDRGPAWYDDLFTARAPGVFRMDASTSYTYPQFPEALDRLAEAAPDAHVVYVVREPLARAVSHYLLRRFTLNIEEAPTFGAALLQDTYYTDVSDYERWITQLRSHFPAERLLVVPFPVLTSNSHDVATVICSRLGLQAPPLAADSVTAHRNAVVEFRGSAARRAVKALRHSAVYPRIRSVVGADRIRKARSLIVRPTELPTVAEALDTCSAEQRAELMAFRDRVHGWVGTALVEQDAATGLSWAEPWRTPFDAGDTEVADDTSE